MVDKQIKSDPDFSREPDSRGKVLSIIMWLMAGAMVIMATVLAVINPPSFLKPTPTTPSATAIPIPTPSSDGVEEVALMNAHRGIYRATNPHTALDDKTRKLAIEYTVGEGDSLFAIAKQFDLEPESIFWANIDIMQGSPDMLAPGITLRIPPSDGVLYKWKEGDSLQAIADKFYGSVDSILLDPANQLDLTDPKIEPDKLVMIPGGKREAIQWFQGQIPRGSAGTLSKLLGDGGCDTSAGGAVGDGSFGWPIDGAMLTGNDYIGGVHQGIDLGSLSSGVIVAADSGLVVYSGWANGGYGYTIMIDHGNGYQTLYAHMSALYASCNVSVGQGTGIGLIGSTGNSTGPHLHFEVRYMGLNDNPWNYIQ